MSHYSLKEEIWNISTHAFGILFGIGVLGYAIYTLAVGDYPLRAHAAMWIYGLCFILLYTTSTLYHSMFRKPNLRKICQRFDHASIFFMIAGSYTPMLWIALAKHGGFSWSILIWTIAAIGATFKLFFAGKFPWLSTICYLVMGWLSIILVPDLLATVPMNGIYALLAGGIAYSLGALFYMWKKLPYHHAIWHFFVLAGSGLQWLTIQYYVLPGSAL